LSADARREEIVGAARRLFAVNGYHATTTREIARAAEVSDALLYRHFDNKRELLDQVIDQAIATFGSLPPLERLGSLSTANLLRALGTGFLERVSQNVDLLTILIGEHATVTDYRFATFVDGAASALGTDLHRREPTVSTESGYLTARSFFGSLISFVLMQGVLRMDDVRPIPPTDYLDHLVTTTLPALTHYPHEAPSS
jgi:AcrR family transcriptional regulator